MEVSGDHYHTYPGTYSRYSTSEAGEAAAPRYGSRDTYNEVKLIRHAYWDCSVIYLIVLKPGRISYQVHSKSPTYYSGYY